MAVRLHYGFMQDVDVPRALRACEGLDLDGKTTYFLGREWSRVRPAFVRRSRVK
jgi:hypothetical protein